jgi:hypothetical protein
MVGYFFARLLDRSLLDRLHVRRGLLVDRLRGRRLGLRSVGDDQDAGVEVVRDDVVLFGRGDEFLRDLDRAVHAFSARRNDHGLIRGVQVLLTFAGVLDSHGFLL